MECVIQEQFRFWTICLFYFPLSGCSNIICRYTELGIPAPLRSIWNKYGYTPCDIYQTHIELPLNIRKMTVRHNRYYAHRYCEIRQFGIWRRKYYLTYVWYINWLCPEIQCVIALPANALVFEYNMAVKMFSKKIKCLFSSEK